MTGLNIELIRIIENKQISKSELVKNPSIKETVNKSSNMGKKLVEVKEFNERCSQRKLRGISLFEENYQRGIEFDNNKETYKYKEKTKALEK